MKMGTPARSLNLRLACMLFLAWACAASAVAVTIHAPTTIKAGNGFSVATDGSGSATLYLLGPGTALKQAIQLGGNANIPGEKVTIAGQYRVIVCSGDDCSQSALDVQAGEPARLSFFLHPSRVPVSRPDAIDGTAFVFDRYYNPVFVQSKVDFQITPASGAGSSKVVSSDHGVAWIRLGSGRAGGPVRITASIAGVSEPRVIQQVAADACSLRIKAVRDAKGLTVETDPVRDCSGNPLPDGTIVSFTTKGSAGMTTVDTPIKKGIARTQLTVKGNARVSVACGVVLGNELSVAGNM